MNHPYWLVKISNPNSPFPQWKDHAGNSVSAFVFSNAQIQIGHYIFYPSSRLGNNGYYNLGLQVYPFRRSISGDFFENPLEDISNISFSFSKAWKEIFYPDVSTSDFWEVIRSNSGASFKLDGAKVEAWLCNGAVTGYRNVAIDTWAEIAGPATKSYEDSNYQFVDSKQLVFSGSILKVSKDRERYFFSCESDSAKTDILIGETVKGGDNSTATIKPIPFGRILGDDGDIHGGFPLAEIDNRVGVLKLSANKYTTTFGNANVFRLLFRDANTDRLVKVTSDFEESTGNIILSADVAGATLSKNRTSGGKWNLDPSEIADIFGAYDASFSNISKQVIHNQGGEEIGLHGHGRWGTSDAPVVTTTSITFNQNERLDSRGWNDSLLNSHLAGQQYKTDSSKAVAIRIECEQLCPIIEMVSKQKLGDGYIGGVEDGIFRGISGDIWRLFKATNDGNFNIGSETPGLEVSQRGYGPSTWDGNVQLINGVPFWSSANRVDTFRFIIRPKKPDIKSEDLISSVSLRFSGKINITNPNGTVYAKIQAEHKPSLSGNVSFQEVSQTTTTTITGQYLPVGLQPFPQEDFENIFDGNGIALTIEIKGSFDGAEPDTIWRHVMVEIYRLALYFYYESNTQNKKFIWQGTGVLPIEGDAEDVDQNIKTLVAMHSNLPVVSSVLNVSPHSGYFASRVSMRDALKQISADHNLLIVNNESGIEILEAKRSSVFKTVTEADIYLDDALLLDIQFDESDLQDLYSEVSLKFRERADDGDFAEEIIIGDGYKSWNRSQKNSVYNSEDWYLLTSTNLANLNILCGEAYKSLGGTTKRYESEARHIRDRAEAEKRIARLVLLLTQKRKRVSLKGKLSSWLDVQIGSQIEFGLTEGNTDSYIYQHLYGGYPRRFIITSVEITGDGSEAGCAIEASELPYIPVLDFL